MVKFQRNGMGGYQTPCGTVRLSPLYMGCTNVQAWRLEFKTDGKYIDRGFYNLLREAKEAGNSAIEYLNQGV